MRVVLRGPELAVQTCARRLGPVGLDPVRAAGGVTGPDEGDGRMVLAGGQPGGQQDRPVEVNLSWFGPGRVGTGRGSEAVVQAMSGLMAIHGRDDGVPRRLGLEVASVAAGILAAHAVVAAMVGRRRGVDAAPVATSALQAGLLLCSHRIAAETTGTPWSPVPDGPDPGPPFSTADQHRFEIETMDPVAWRAFWTRLGTVRDVDLEWAWRLFRPRYFRGTCTLPAGLHQAAAERTFAEVEAAAAACSVSLCRIRGYDEVLADLGAVAGHPDVTALGVAPPAATPPEVGAATLPLAGIRVVEATSRLQGPLAGLLLQMLGADVVHVEPPIGDFTRTIPPLVGDTGTFFLSFNRGKQTVEVDLARPAGRAQLAGLTADADVFLHNWRPGKAAEWSLRAHDLAAANPGLVYAEASGWGDDPALSRRLGTDFLVQAHAGVAHGITPDGQPPSPSRALLTDYLGALSTTEAILAGLDRRQRAGRGQRVGASLLASAMSLQAHVLEAVAAGNEKGRRGGRPVWGVLDRPLPTADGFLVVTVEDDTDLRRLTTACGVDLDAPVATIHRRVADHLAGHPTRALAGRLTDAGLACTAVCTDPAGLAGDPHLRGLLEPLGTTARVPASPWRWGS